MEFNNSKEKEVIVDIESGVASHGDHVKRDSTSGDKWWKISLHKLVGGVLRINGSAESEPTMKSDDICGGSVECQQETIGLLVDKNPGRQQGQGPTPLAEKDHEKERRKAGKVKKAPKPPRPPRGPSLDAADMRLIKEISRIAMKKRERIERMKTLKKMKAARLSSPPPPTSSSGGTISAMIITVLFFLVLIFQGLGSSISSNLTHSESPQPAPDPTGLTPVQFYQTVLSDDGAAPSFLPPKSTD